MEGQFPIIVALYIAVNGYRATVKGCVPFTGMLCVNLDVSKDPSPELQLNHGKYWLLNGTPARD